MNRFSHYGRRIHHGGFAGRRLPSTVLGLVLALAGPTYAQSNAKLEAGDQKPAATEDDFLTGNLAKLQAQRKKQQETRRSPIPLPATNPDGSARKASAPLPDKLDSKAKAREARAEGEKAARERLEANSAASRIQLKAVLGQELSVEPAFFSVTNKAGKNAAGLESVMAWRKAHGRDKRVSVPLPPPPGTEASTLSH